MALPTISITGNVKRPEFRYTSSGKAVHKFSLECGEKNKDGTFDNLYIDVTTFDKSAEFVNQYFQEGSVAIVTGKLVTKVWADKENKKHYDITFKFPSVEFAPKDKTGQSAQPQQPKQEQEYPQSYNNHTEYKQPAKMPSKNSLPSIDIDDEDIPPF